MYLSKLFKQLATGELSQVAISENGSIQEDSYDAIITHLNIGLTKLYTRFPLLEKEVVIQQFEHITQYRLSSKYAVSNEDSTEVYKYIIDSTDNPFMDDVLRVEQVFDEEGNYIKLNDEYTDGRVFFTPAYDLLQIPMPEENNAVFVTYRADHPEVVLEDQEVTTTIPGYWDSNDGEEFWVDPVTTVEIVAADPSTVEISIPPYLEEALLSFIASRVHSTRSSDGAQSESSKYYGKYNAICNDIEVKNMTNNSPTSTNIRPEINGWV